MTFQEYIEEYRNRIIKAGILAIQNPFFNKCIISWIRYMPPFHILNDLYSAPAKISGKNQK